MRTLGGGGGQVKKIYKIANFVFILLFMQFTTLLNNKTVTGPYTKKWGGG